MKKNILYILLSISTISMLAQTMNEIVAATLEFFKKLIQGIVDELRQPDKHEISFNADNIRGGIYYYQL